MEIAQHQVICLQDDCLRDYQQQAKQSFFQAWDSLDNVKFFKMTLPTDGSYFLVPKEI